MLRPSSLLSGAASSTTTTTAAPKSFLRPATFQVGSTTDDTATESGGNEASTSSEPSPVAAASSSTTPSSIANNPFLAMTSNYPDDEDDTAANEAKPKTTTSENGDKSSEKPLNGLPKANLFKTANPTIPTTTTTSGFVFGQNVHERVTGESIHSECTSSSPSTATSSQLFAIAGSSAQPDSAGTPPVEASVECLNEVARVYEESRAQKRKYDEVETFTGEEDELNVLDVNGKLFTFVASNWEERGPGNLRVNDNKDRKKNSRVVFRTSGNLRVLINTKIWPGMVVERPSQKSLRFSAIDCDGQIKIYLAMARPDDITNLFNQITKRINYEKSRPVPVVQVADDDTPVEDATADAAAASTSPVQSSPTSSGAAANTPTIQVTTVDDDSGESEVVHSPEPKRIALDSTVSTTKPTPDDDDEGCDDGVDTTTENVN